MAESFVRVFPPLFYRSSPWLSAFCSLPRCHDVTGCTFFHSANHLPGGLHSTAFVGACSTCENPTLSWARLAFILQFISTGSCASVKAQRKMSRGNSSYDVYSDQEGWAPGEAAECWENVSWKGKHTHTHTTTLGHLVMLRWTQPCTQQIRKKFRRPWEWGRKAECCRRRELVRSWMEAFATTLSSDGEMLFMVSHREISFLTGDTEDWPWCCVHEDATLHNGPSHSKRLLAVMHACVTQRP